MDKSTFLYNDSPIGTVPVSGASYKELHGFNGRKVRKLDVQSILRIASDVGGAGEGGDDQSNATGKLAKIKLFWLAAGDATACVLSVVLAYFLVDVFKYRVYPSHSRLSVTEALELAPLLFCLPILCVLLLCHHKGHYTRFKRVWDELGEFWLICLSTAGMTVVFLYFAQHQLSRLWLLGAWSFVLLLVPIARFLVKKQLKSHNYWFTPTVVIGTGPNALTAALAIESDENMGFRVVSVIDTTFPEPTSSDDVAHLSVRDELSKRYKSYPVNKRLGDCLTDSVPHGRPYVVLALEAEDYTDHQDIVEEFIVSRRNLSIFPPVNALPLIGTEIDPIYRHEALHLRVRTNLANWRSRLLKRFFDVVVSFIGLVVLSPLFLFLYLKVRSDGGVAFYGQERVGCGGRIFRCWKFRSMHTNADDLLAKYLETDPSLSREYKENQKLETDPRVTPFGRFIRKYSLDEIPQLFNVLVGSMSIVGPRPVRIDELQEKYGASARYYLMSAPGITGIWQTSGRSALNYDTRVKLDVWYVRNWTLWGDLKIVLNTTSVVFAGQGAY